MSAILLVALALGAPSDSDKPDATKVDPAKADLAKLQGVWKVTSLESRGMSIAPPAGFPGARVDRYTLVIVDNAYVLGTHAGTITLDPAKKALDLAITDGRYKDGTVAGLYSLSGDTLKIAMRTPSRNPAPGERPTDFKTGPDDTFTVYTFERDPKATKEQAAAKLKELKDALTTGIQPGPGPGPGFQRPAAADRVTQELLRQVIERLDRIEKRLDAMERKTPDPEKKPADPVKK